MAVPDYQSLMRPLLDFSSDGHEKRIKDAIDGIATKLHLTDEDRVELLPSGKKTVLSDRVQWAATYLAKAGAIQRTKRAHFQITDLGRQLLKDHPDGISVPVLKQFPEFLDFLTGGSPGGSTNEQINIPVGSSEITSSVATPDEAIQQAEKQITDALKGQLLDRISELSPAFFESLVIDLIVAMGYGGSRASVVQRLGKSGDAGIDGVVNEDPLGLDVVYVQAKRYAAANSIGRDVIQQFAGALDGKRATKGIFLTTSSFTKGAAEYVNTIPKRIILIDGSELTRLMVQYGVGVRTEQTVEIKRIDLDYFDEGDE
jgi:restriction system protein